MPTSICEPTEYRSFRKGNRSVEQLRLIVTEIAFHRWYACRQAEFLVELNCDDYVTTNLVEVALKESSLNHSVEAVVHDRLERLFVAALEDRTRRQAFERLFQRHVAALPEDVRCSVVQTEADGQCIDWEVWLRTYRNV